MTNNEKFKEVFGFNLVANTDLCSIVECEHIRCCECPLYKNDLEYSEYNNPNIEEGGIMTRTEEVTEKQKTFSDMLNELNEHKLMKDQSQITNINLASIAEQLSDISTSLAMFLDYIKESE